VDASRDAERTTGTGRVGPGRLRAIAKILIIDVAAPLATYSLLRSAGLSTVTSLVLSGVIPAFGVAAGFIRNRHLDVVGALVLAGIVVGSVLGLLTHSPRLVLTEGSVPTVVFGAACLGSLGTKRPLMFGFALEFIGPDTPTGREMTNLWQYAEYQRIFRTITIVWGVGFLLEAALRVVIVYNTSTGTAMATSKVTPYIWIAGLMAWTVAYGRYRKRKGEREDAAAAMPQPGSVNAEPVESANPAPVDHEER
jgi:intracellular septation protein A